MPGCTRMFLRIAGTNEAKVTLIEYVSGSRPMNLKMP
jgi:hypothetical protein